MIMQPRKSADFSGDLVTWQDAEDALTAAIEYLFALPDRERGFLSAGSRSGWPQIVRSVREGDYGEGQGENEDARPPSPQLTRRMVALVERMLTGEAPIANAVPEGQRGLVCRVVVMKRWPGPDGFRWERVWEMQGGFASGTTTDALRVRYSRAIEKIANRMNALGVAAG